MAKLQTNLITTLFATHLFSRHSLGMPLLHQQQRCDSKDNQGSWMPPLLRVGPLSCEATRRATPPQTPFDLLASQTQPGHASRRSRPA